MSTKEQEINLVELKLLIEVAICGTDKEMVSRTTAERLIELELIELEANYELTQRGKTHINQILNLSMPELIEIWVDGKGDRI